MTGRTKGIGALLAAGAVGILGSAGAVNFFTKELLDGAMNRECRSIVERERQRMRDDECFSPFLAECDRAGERLHEMGHETVSIAAFDGICLKGHLFEKPRTDRIILAMHGWRSSWELDFGLISDFLLSSSTVLFAEERAHGESEGEYITFGMLERDDVTAWCRFIAERYGDTPIFLYGVSMGGSTVLLSADREHEGNVVGIISDCAFTSPHEIWEHMMKTKLHMSYVLHKSGAEKLCLKRISISPSSFSTENALSKTSIPVLVIHGMKDRVVPPEMAYKNLRAAAGEKRLLRVPLADHAMSYYTDSLSYEREMTDFFRDYGK